MPGEDLVTIILNHPLFWMAVMGVIVYFIIKEVNKGKLQPEAKPFWGMQVREGMVDKQLKKRQETFSIPNKYNLFWGYAKIGKVKNSETVITNPTTIMHITYVGNGLWNWVKGLFGYGLRHVLCEPNVLHKENRNKNLVIDHHAFFQDIAGIWCQTKKGIIDFLEGLMNFKDYENVKGFVSDFPRRLSNLSPAQAIHTERQYLDNELELQKDRSKLDRIMGRK